eukprot:1718416-Amphidinium_carterae.1
MPQISSAWLSKVNPHARLQPIVDLPHNANRSKGHGGLFDCERKHQDIQVIHGSGKDGAHQFTQMS